MSLVKFFPNKSKVILALFLIGLVLYGLFAKVKWYVYPLYLFLIFFLVLIFINNKGNLNLTAVKSGIIIAVSLLLILSPLILRFIFSEQDLPRPSGDFDIGTKVYELEDQSRNEVYTDDKNDKRKIKYQVWYPTTDIQGLEKASWITEGKILTHQLAKTMFVPPFMLDQTANIESNSYIEAPLTPALSQVPVVVISHGWKGFRELHTDYAEELASNGFIAVSIDHSYGAQAVKFDDGKIAYLSRDALPSGVLPKKFMKASNLLARTYGEDVLAVLDDLERLNQEDETFKQRLNLNKLGLQGHSTGGGGDVYASIKDDRIKAMIGLDAWVEPLDKEFLEKGMKIPSLFFRSGKWENKRNNINLKALIENSTNQTLIQTEGTRHVDFTMAYMFSSYTNQIGFTGQHGGREASMRIKELSLEFFDQHLRGQSDINPGTVEEIIKENPFMEIVNDYK